VNSLATPAAATPPDRSALARNAASSVSSTTKSSNKAQAPAGASGGTAVIVNLPPVPGGCTTPDPFAKNGGVGLCVQGEWLLLWKPTAKKRGG
jgi:hypothetical protein